MKQFEEMGLSPDVLEAMKEKGFKEPTPIQEQTIPILMGTDLDLVGQAKTGTGKTAAFGVPMIEKLSPGIGKIQALILTPTRELALQVAGEIDSLKGNKKFKILAVYGGQSINNQIRAIQKGVDIVVGTPGRILDLINRGKLNFSGISWLVLDEADEMLNMGFIDDVEEILSSTSEEKRVLLFSATMPRKILTLAKKYMGEYKLIKVSDDNSTSDLTIQYFYRVYSKDKPELLRRIIEKEEKFYALVFCNTKVEVDGLNRALTDMGFASEAIHGDFSQYQRERVLYKFRNRLINILIATDVAARGLDIPELTHVINYNVPQHPEAYIHRIGRTGRAGKGGIAITFVSPEEESHFNFIRRIVKGKITQVSPPDIAEIITAKRKRFMKTFLAKLESFDNQDYLQLAGELLNEASPEKLIAALLQEIISDSMENYAPIEEVKSGEANEIRMFAAVGKENGLGPEGLIEMIREKVDIDPMEIKNIRMFDRFSFFTVPSYYADIIIKSFRKRGRRSIFDRAKPRK